MPPTPRIPEPPWTIRKLLEWASSLFCSRGIDNPRSTAEILLAHAISADRIEFYRRPEKEICQEDLERYRDLVDRRLDREPVAYIVGEKEFWSMELLVTPDVLIPRPETECLVEQALPLLSEGSIPKRVLEVGTGSGAIVLALASERPGHLYFASDRSVAALAVALCNAKRHGLDDRVRFFAGDWFEANGKDTPRFDLILSNPPYIPAQTIPELQEEVRDFEPRSALDGGEDGLRCLEKIIFQAHPYLRIGGYLLLEIGYDQRSALDRMIAATGRYGDVRFFRDYAGHDRGVLARRIPA